MTPDQADDIVRAIGAAYPRDRWGDDTTALWLSELEHLGHREATIAARRMIRAHEFASVAAFHAELAEVRSLAADGWQARRDSNIRALGEGIGVLASKADALDHIADIRAAIAAKGARDAAVLGPDRRRRVTERHTGRTRYDEDWFREHGYIE